MHRVSRLSRQLNSYRNTRRLLSTSNKVSWGRGRKLAVVTYPALRDNYGFIVHCSETGATAAVDTPDGHALLEQLNILGWTLTHILNTHHHHDHVGGNEIVLQSLGKLEVLGPIESNGEIPGLTRSVSHGDSFQLGNHVGSVLDVSGHTLGHVAFLFEEEGIMFPGDSIFPLGCGRVFEGTAAQMYKSLERIWSLAEDTLLFSAHEYTLSNAKFALSVDPHNQALQQAVVRYQGLRDAGEPTVPTTVGMEKKTNPFLTLPTVTLGDEGPKENWQVFQELRKRKDTF